VSKASVPAVALLPVRLFFGATFVYAGLDKLLDPAFFDATAATSLHAQLEAFARFSPLGDLIRATLPLSTPIGLLIAIGEIGIGIGALTGLAFRVAAAGGAAMSLLFFLTASWATHPYYFGADLPYAFGWSALAIAGHGGLLVPRRVLDLNAAAAGSRGVARRPSGRRARRRGLAGGLDAPPVRGETLVGYGPASRSGPRHATDEVPSAERRLLLQTALLAGIAAVLGSLTLPLRALGVMTENGPAGASPTPSGDSGGTRAAAAPTPTPAPSQAAAPPGSVAVARIVDVTRSGSTMFQVPFDAPSSLPAGDPAVIVELPNGSFVAFDAVCTHAGCTVQYDRPDRVLICPCHEAVYDPANDAAVLGGPAPFPLTKLPIVVDQASGQIYLTG
jgi:thiosulfate dehydrogenase [quinone] large subunit